MLRFQYVTISFETDGEFFSASTARSLYCNDVSLQITQDGGRFSASLHSSRKIILRELKAVFSCEFSDSDRIFLNGYQSWTDSYEHTICSRMRGLHGTPARIIRKYALDQYGDYRFTDDPNQTGRLHGWSYGYIRTGPEFQFFGSLAEDSGFTQLKTDTRTQTLTAEKDCAGLHLEGNYEGLQLLLCEGNEKSVFDAYFDALGVKLRPEAKPIFGYTSWYRHYQNISAGILREDMEGLLRQQYKPDAFQIDDGYQTAVGDWLSVNPEKFPDGMADFAGKIRKNGMIPGIWLAPFVCEKTSRLYAEHPDWVVTDEKGEPVTGGSNWSGFYALDIYNEAFRSHLREVFRTVTQDWGYRLLKLDFLYAACIQPRQDKTRGQIMADGMRFLREIAGDAFLLGCGVPLASAFGRVDYCRIGCDVSLSRKERPYLHRERVSTRNTVLDSVFRRQLNGRAFRNDPDVFLLRYEQNQLTAAQKTCLAEINALCGSVLFTSDNAADYDAGQLRVLRRLMRLRADSEIISAELTGRKLKIYVRYHEKRIVRTYSL